MFFVEMRTEPPTLDPLDLPEGTVFFDVTPEIVAAKVPGVGMLRFTGGEPVPDWYPESRAASDGVEISRKSFVARVKAVSAAP